MKQSYLKTMLSRDKNYRTAFWLAVLLPIGSAVAAVVVGCNSGYFAHLLPPCALNTLTGLHCLSCGATRATLALVRGDLLTALYYNPLYFAFLCWLGYLYARLLISLIRRPYQKYSLHVTLPWGIAAIAAVLLFFFVRNTPFYRLLFY